MTVTAIGADGSRHEFPDGTNPSVVDRVMKDYASSASSKASTAPQSGFGRYLSESAGAAGEGLRQLPGAAGEALGEAGKFLGRVVVPPRAQPSWLQPSAEEGTLSGLTTFLTGGLMNPIAPEVKAVAGAGKEAAGAYGRAIESEPEPAALTNVPQPSRIQAKAQRIVSNAFARDVKAGGPTAAEVLEQFAKAKAEDQPLTLPDISGKGMQRFAGSVYRGPGAAGTIMKKFYDAREKDILDETLDTAAGARIAQGIDRYLAPGSARETAKVLAATRSQNARPLWDKAMEGGSIAPLESQFEDAFNVASKAEADANKAFQQAYQKLTAARGKQAQAGNVYSSSAGNRVAREAQAEIRSTEATLARATSEKNAIRERLQQAQADRTAEAKGAVWSPRIQEYLDEPIFKEGLRRGYTIERLKAKNEGRPFNPHEYAILGEAPDGSPIVGKVPNMPLLQMAKEGVDAMLYEHDPLRQNPLTDPLTGRRTKYGREVESALHEFVSEADRLNPDWRPAREQWSGDTASLRSLRDGANMFKPGLSVEQLQEDFAALPEGDKELFRLGSANTLKQDLDRARQAGDPSKAIINNTEDRKKFRAIFDTKEKFDKFRSFIERERAMFEVPYGEIMGGSQTAERGASDAAWHGLRALFHGAHGHVLGAADAMMRAARHLPARARTNEEVARLLTNPRATLATDPGGRLRFDVNEIVRRAAELPRQPVPPSP